MPADLPLLLMVAGAGALASLIGGVASLLQKPTTLALSISVGFAAGVLLGVWGFVAYGIRQGAAGGARGGLRSELTAAFADITRRGLHERLRWKLIDVGSANRENAAVTGIRLATSHPLAKVPARILVDARNFGASDRKFVTGELEVSEAVRPGAEPAATPDGSSAKEAPQRSRRARPRPSRSS